MRSSSLSLRALAAAMPFVLNISAAQAQEAREVQPENLGTILLSAGSSPIAEAEYGRAYSVLTAEELHARGITSVQDALRSLPGVSVNGAGRSATAIRIRGGEDNHTLILVDGVAVTGGGDDYGLSGLDIADIERVEVLRGPQSVYYGSNASSGVINIMTRRADGPAYGGKFELGNGHFAHLYAQTGDTRGGLRLSLTDHDDHGVDESGEDGERDFIDRQTLRLNADWQATDALKFRAGLSFAREHSAYDLQNYATATDPATSVLDDREKQSWKRETALSFGAGYEASGGRLIHDLSVTRSRNKGRRADSGLHNVPAAPGEWSKGTSERLKYRATWGIDGTVTDATQLVNILAEHAREQHSSAPGKSREASSLALEYRGSFDNGLSIQAGLRYDDNKGFADFTGFNLAAAWQINDQWQLHGALGRASVNPNYYELYADDGYTIGNPNLAPEENRGGDLGLRYSSSDGNLTADLTLFHEVLYDEITWVFDPGLGASTYYNQAGKSRRKGVELATSWQAGDQLRLGLNYTWLKATNPDDSRELRRPQHELGLQISWQSPDARLSLSGDLRHVAGNYDTQYFGAFAVAKLKDYTVVNVAASYELTDHVTLTGRVLNLFDTEYSDTWGYRAQDRAYWLGLSADF